MPDSTTPDNECTCGLAWNGHPEPHACDCPKFGAANLRCVHRLSGFCDDCRLKIAAVSS